MTPDPNDVVKVASGDTVAIELYRQRLAEAGIEARTLGDRLEASFGTVIGGSIELWVHRSDAARAADEIQQMERDRGKPAPEHPSFPHPADDPHKPHAGGHGPHTHYDARPGS